MSKKIFVLFLILLMCPSVCVAIEASDITLDEFVIIEKNNERYEKTMKPIRDKYMREQKRYWREEARQRKIEEYNRKVQEDAAAIRRMNAQTIHVHVDNLPMFP